MERTFTGTAWSAGGVGESIGLIESSFHDEMGRARADLCIDSVLGPYSQGEILQMDNALLLDLFSAKFVSEEVRPESPKRWWL